MRKSLYSEPLMSVEHRFTLLGDARTERFRVWPSSHSTGMLLAKFDVRLGADQYDNVPQIRPSCTHI